jgi:hypothetical protein
VVGAQVKASRLPVNRSATWADWDLELVGLEIEELKGLNFDLNLTGFDRLEMEQVLAGAGELPQEEIAEPSQEPVTRLGDVWSCGPMRRPIQNTATAARSSTIPSWALARRWSQRNRRGESATGLTSIHVTMSSSLAGRS